MDNKNGDIRNYFCDTLGEECSNNEAFDFEYFDQPQKFNFGKTYDVHFNNEYNGNDEGFHSSFEECLDWIEFNRQNKYSYFGDYRGGTVSIVCNETGEEVYSEPIP